MKKNKELLFSITKKDFDIEYYSGSGRGGANRNAHKQCVRLKHQDSGVTTRGTESRSRESNLKTAFHRMTNHPDFKKWLKIESSRRMGEYQKEEEYIKKKVDVLMKDDNLKIEYYNPNK